MAPIGQIFTHVLQSLQSSFISIHVSTSSSAAIGHTLTQAPQYPHLYRFTVTVIVKLQHQQSDNYSLLAKPKPRDSILHTT